MKYRTVGLGGLVFSVLSIAPKVHEFKPGRERAFLMATKLVARLPSEGKKPSVQCRKILRHVKDPYSIKSDT
jgi:hypothetical protein